MSTNIERLEVLFNRALDFRADERAAFLAGACGSDATLLERVTALLRAHDADHSLLSAHPRTDPAAGPPAEQPGDCIGSYKLLQQIGEGGCGVVYMAEQLEPVRRLVALKVIKLGMDTKKVVARFEAERQALALMDHPNIARVLDAGTSITGRPFFVMELVRGIRITDYCDRHRLSTRQRLELVIQVCRAIQHAHQKGIVHRDIKPSNVLVTVHDGVPVPKVIDFGIAKAIEGRLTTQTLFTPFEQFVGTPAYMSPEQAQLNGLDVDTRTDIYSLGVLLYELLTGKTPFDADELSAAGLDEMRRTIREQEPPRPSTRLTLELAAADPAKRGKLFTPDAPKVDGTAEQKQLLPTDAVLPARELIQALRRDLDWIVLKCLEKDRTRRYETANGLAMDLLRHLKGEPVTARPPSNWYRFQKLVRRNRLLFAAACAVTVALVLGTMVSTWEAVLARRAEQAQLRLRVEADQARAAEVRQRAAAELHLYDALLGEARAKQLSGRAGQRFESLEAITKAAALHKSTELSDAAVAALTLPDLRARKSWELPSHWAAENVRFDPQFSRYAYRTATGISVRRLADDLEEVALPVKGLRNGGEALAIRGFNSSSRYLAASCDTEDQGERCRVWDLIREGALALDLESFSEPEFSPDGQAIAVMNRDGTLSVRRIDSNRDLNRFSVAERLDLLRFSRDGSRLAGAQAGSTNVRIWELASGQIIATLPSSGKLSALAWNSDGTLLATGLEDGPIDLWEPQSGRLRARIEGHARLVARLAFSHQGDWLASGSWDHTLRLWDVASGQQLVIYRTPDTDLAFTADDRALGHAISGETIQLLDVAASVGFRRLTGAAESGDWRIGGFSPDGRWVVASSLSGGIAIWDLGDARLMGTIPATECRSALFSTNGGLSVIGSTARGLYRWPIGIQTSPVGSYLRVGPPQTLAAPDASGNLALDRIGRRIIVASSDAIDPLLLDLAEPNKLVRLRGLPGPGFVAMSPSGRWAAKSVWKGAGVNVYDVATGQLARRLPVKRTAFVTFSPDDKWLATADMMELKIWNTESWEPCPTSVPGDRVSEVNPLAFSPDGQLLAAAHGSYYEIKILKMPSCEVVATLPAPTLAAITSLSFNPDGSKLTALEWSGRLEVWDLRILREELQKLKLDWDIPPFPAMTEAPSSAPASLELDAAPFSKIELAERIPARRSNTSTNLLDLTAYYNAPLTESWHSPKEARNDLSELTPGVNHLSGTDFDVRGLIQLGANAANGLSYPTQVCGIRVSLQCHRLQFLHAAIRSTKAKPGERLGSFIVQFVDGRKLELPLLAGKDLADWWAQPGESGLEAAPAWQGNNPAAQRAGCTLRLFKTCWENPFPKVAIRQFDFVSESSSAGLPFLVAVTAEP